MKRHSILTLILTFAMILLMFSGCSTNTTTAQPTGTTGTGSTTATAEPVTVTVWVELESDRVAPIVQNLGDIPLYKKLQELTGINIKFEHPPTGQATEQFNLMVASRTLPDVFEFDWNEYYPGGSSKAAADGILIPLTEYYDGGQLPNLKAVMDREDLEKQIRMDDGNIYDFPMIRGDDRAGLTYGPQIRKDYLEKLNLSVPETMDEWTTMLRAFKNELKVPIPLSFEIGSGKYPESSLFVGAYGIGAALYLDKGMVKFGPGEAAFKNYLTQMKDWYAEGLLDPDTFSQDRSAVDTKVVSEMAGSWGMQVGGGLGTYLDAMKGTEFDIVGAVYPSLTKGEPAGFMRLNHRVNAHYVGITTQCDVIEAALKLYDFGYGPVGNMLLNYGIEGESYTMVDGKPTYLDSIFNPPDGSTMAFALTPYVRSHWYIPGFQEPLASIMFNERLPQQVQAKDAWMESAPVYVKEHQLPPVTLKTNETQDIANKLNEILTYTNEMTAKYVIGSENLDTFDNYIKIQNDLGLAEVLAAYQAAYDRYIVR